MKRLALLTGMVCLLSMSSMLVVSCSSDDDVQENTEQDINERRQRQLTFAEVSITRATLEDNTNTLGAKWSVGDKATVLNVSALPQELLYGDMTAETAAMTSTFTGSIGCRLQDKLALIYPKVTPATGNGHYTIDLRGQKGTLQDVATNYHFVYGVGEVTAVTGAAATATISEMQSLLALCKFTFRDRNTNAAIPVKTLTINYEYSGYPLTATVTPNINGTPVVAEPDYPDDWDEKSLTVSLDNETSDGVYMVLFPVNNYSIVFTVTGSAGTYSGTATATLKGGKYYAAGMKLDHDNNNQ